MPNITASFKNNYGQSRRWVIADLGRDPNIPPVLFNDYLEPDEKTPELILYSSDGLYGQAQYQRSDGTSYIVNISDHDSVDMS